ncbi:MAG: hypothetical protein V4559_08900 [Pseudomonadota bacterium]
MTMILEVAAGVVLGVFILRALGIIASSLKGVLSILMFIYAACLVGLTFGGLLLLKQFYPHSTLTTANAFWFSVFAVASAAAVIGAEYIQNAINEKIRKRQDARGD